MVHRRGAGVGVWGRGRVSGRAEEVEVSVASGNVELPNSGDTWAPFLQWPVARARRQCLTVRTTGT